MLTQIRRLITGALTPILLLGLTEVGMASIPKGKVSLPASQQTTGLSDRVRHSLLMLPYYTVFDHLAFSIEGDTVVLTGEVRWPTLRIDAEEAVKRVSGVAKVVNQIEVLPLSPMDDSIRLMTYRAIYSKPGFERYGVQAVKPIRIIVKNGNITLDGVVGSQLDKTMAEMAARSVPFAFTVTNNLTVD